MSPALTISSPGSSPRRSLGPDRATSTATSGRWARALFEEMDTFGLVDTYWAIILPSLVSPFGLYLMRVYAEDAVPDSLIEAARIDGAGEAQIFFRIALRLLATTDATVASSLRAGSTTEIVRPALAASSSSTPAATKSPP